MLAPRASPDGRRAPCQSKGPGSFRRRALCRPSVRLATWSQPEPRRAHGSSWVPSLSAALALGQAPRERPPCPRSQVTRARWTPPEGQRRSSPPTPPKPPGSDLSRPRRLRSALPGAANLPGRPVFAGLSRGLSGRLSPPPVRTMFNNYVGIDSRHPWPPFLAKPLEQNKG